MTTTTKTEADEHGLAMTHRQIMFVIVGLMAGMFLSSLNQTVVGTSMRTIADDLHGLSLQAWVTTAFLIVSTITTPIYGKLSDLFGRRPLFIIAITIFLLGSLLSGFANSMYELAIFRAVQGLGAGGLMALPLTIMGDILAPRERAKYQGYFLAVFGVSSVIGPLLGGLLSGVDQILFTEGWRWVFFINVPIGLVALAIVWKFLHVPHTKREVRIDWWGAALVAVAVVPLILVAEQGREWGWGSAAAIVCYVVAALGLVAFVLVERMMGEAAIIPLSLFRSWSFSMATVLSVIVGFGMFGAMMSLPLYLQLVNGATPTEAGLMTIPMIVGLMASSIVSGQLIAKTGKYRAFPIVGSAFLAGGFLFLTTLTYDKPVWYTMIGMFIIGLGLGQLMQTLTLASQSAVATRYMGVATSAATFFRQIGGTLGTAVIFSVLFARIPDTIAAAFGRSSLQEGIAEAIADPKVLADPANRGVLEILQDAQASGGAGGAGDALSGDTSFLTGADPRLTAPFLDGFAQAAVTVFWVGFVVILVAFVLSFFLRPAPLREKSAVQEAHEAQAAVTAQQSANQMGALVEPNVESDRGEGDTGGDGRVRTGSAAEADAERTRR